MRRGQPTVRKEGGKATRDTLHAAKHTAHTPHGAKGGIGRGGGGGGGEGSAGRESEEEDSQAMEPEYRDAWVKMIGRPPPTRLQPPLPCYPKSSAARPGRSAGAGSTAGGGM